MSFLDPALLLLLLPATWFVWRTRSGELRVDVLRFAVIVLLGLALAGPLLRASDTGRDLVIVVDRSRSMPDGARESALELVRLAEEARRAGDRVGVVAFGADAVLERAPTSDGRFNGFARSVDTDGSDMAEALELALDRLPAGRQGSVLVLSDGEATGRGPIDVARRAAAAGRRIDVRSVARTGSRDLAVERLDLPEGLGALEPFQFSAWVRTDERIEADFVLERDGAVLARGRRVFEPGVNRLLFRDVLATAGVARYSLRIEGADDRIPENDRAVGVGGVTGERAVRVLNDRGESTPLVAALRAAGIAVVSAAPEGTPLDELSLERFRAVVLENVEASRLGRGMQALRRFVLDRGGGLLMTGGTASFGRGGYHLSPIDELLPVSLEMRQENRKQGMALAIAMDRSGSMSMPSGGVTKMDLANRGAATAIELLTVIDSVSVLAVDTSVHEVVPTTAVDDVAAIRRRVLGITSGGGGIYVRTALVAAAQQLAKAPQLTKHIVLFADAADAEEQEGCAKLVADLVETGVSLSVIALGTRSDSDASFLESIARIGGGQVYFTTDASELPRLFAQDTLVVSRSTFIDQPTPARLLPDLFGLGELAARALPPVGGYNVTYLRDGALLGAVTADEDAAPLLAFHHRGLGRAAVYTGEVGGKYGADLVAWEGFEPLFTTLARWLGGQEEPEALFASLRREGREGVVTVEVDPSAASPPDTSQLAALLSLPDGTSAELPLMRVAGQRYEARFPLEREGVVLGAVRVDDERSLRLPPLALPYSPEFEPHADRRRGERLLARIALETGGAVAPAADELLRGPRHGRAVRSIARELAALALILWLLEIAVRRLGLRVSLPRRILAWIGALLSSLRRRPANVKPARVPTTVAPPADDETPQAEVAPAAEPPRPGLADALARARRAADRELER